MSDQTAYYSWFSTLMTMVNEGKGASKKANDVRDKLEEYWEKMTEEEREQTKKRCDEIYENK